MEAHAHDDLRAAVAVEITRGHEHLAVVGRTKWPEIAEQTRFETAHREVFP